MTKFIISRSCFCTHCAKAQRPHKDDLFFVWGSKHQRIIPLTAEHDAPLSKQGFVPCFFEKLAVSTLKSGTYVHYLKTCGINTCGVLVEDTIISGLDVIAKGTHYDEGGLLRTWYVHRMRWKKGMMLVAQWNALVLNWKDTGYELD